MRGRAASRSDRGQAAVELALVLPVVLLLVLAALQVGLVARDVVLVQHAAREAARAAAVDGDVSRIRAAAVEGSGLPADRLEVTVSARGEPGTTVTVTVRYRSPTDVPLAGALVADRVLDASATMRVER